VQGEQVVLLQRLSFQLPDAFGLQGIPCVYYGTEQGLQGTVDGLDSLESVREALWGKPDAFDTGSPLYMELQKIVALRMSEAALRYGRLYFREVSGNGVDFGQSTGAGGVIAFSRVLSSQEIVVIANTNGSQGFSGKVLVDIDINRTNRAMKIAYSNKGKMGTTSTAIAAGNVYSSGGSSSGILVASLPVALDVWEVQILVPE